MISQTEFKFYIGSYEEISKMIRSYAYEEILIAVADFLGETDTQNLELYTVAGYSKDGTALVYQYALMDLVQNIDYYDWLYERLDDNVSKMTFTKLIQYRILPSRAFLEAACTEDEYEKKEAFIEFEASATVIDALLAIKKCVREEYPKLSVGVSHTVSDLWEIPKLIDMMHSDYRYALRYYCEGEESRTVLYALPMPVKEKKAAEIKRVVAMAPYERPWSNVELIKDCGLIPYLLYKNHGCDVSMVGAKGGAYPYKDLVDGLRLEFLESGTEDCKLQYIEDNALSIDCLILRGCYPSNFNVAKLYKRLRPNGKIYVGLDANSAWMDRILWWQPQFMDFMDCCDVIATSCTAMVDHLNEKWPWKIIHIPNGYYNLLGEQYKRLSFEEKENVIITVGRLGTVQKATDVLLEAFALIEDRIPDWKLKLIGNIEVSFESYVGEFFERFPCLKDRVILEGAISDRVQLCEEYAKAKIFALPSAWEGGAPNVIAEGLNAGCVMAVTKIDAYEDIIGGGCCGKASPKGDVEAFAQILLELCTSDKLEVMSKAACEHAKNCFDMEKIVGGLYEQLRYAE